MGGRYQPNVHHRSSARMPRFDYSQNAFYFLTICCSQKECYFGHIADGSMFLNGTGKAAEQYWLQIPDFFPDAMLHAHVIMPNHVHGIIELRGGGGDKGMSGAEGFQPLPESPPVPGRHHDFQKIVPRSIGSIIRGYKAGVTKWAQNNTDIHTIWQRNYYEHVIRNENAYKAITEYIYDNPTKWKDDRFHT